MAFRQKREARYSDLRLVGFTGWEARALSKIPRSVPYLQTMAAQRAAEYAAFKRRKKGDTSERAWDTFIVKRYIMKHWSKGGAARRSKEVVWQMLRHFEDKYKDDHPSYKSPWRTRQRDFRKAERKADNAVKARELRHAIATYNGQDKDFLVTHWKEELNKLEKRQ